MQTDLVRVCGGGTMVKIELLGTGNAFLPSGRMHSLLVIDEHIMVDIPPTALSCLRRRGISPSQIDTILVTHVHGDHVFGIPFLLLERKYISDREGLKTLTIAGSPMVRERIETLCKLAYPGSLDDVLSGINWQEIPEVDGWSFESFVVKHVPEVEPHGWMMRHEDGLVMLHSGDSGPCDELWRRVGECDLAIVEMGLPEFVESDEHHKPSSIETLATNNPDTKIIVTHTYVDDGPEIVSAKIPEHPTNVIHARDGAAFFWNGEEITIL